MTRNDEITARVGELVAKRRELGDELKRLDEIGDPTPGEISRAERQLAALDKIDDELLTLKSEQREIVRSIAAGGGMYSTENGDGPAAANRSPDLVTRGGDPWAGHRNKGLESGEIVRSDALRAIERVKGELVSDDGRAMAQDLIEGGDPQGRDLAAQWALATSDPLYRAAFDRVVRDPMHGYRSWTSDELDAYRRADLVRTAMSLTDSAGGYMVPFTLDPTIILTNAGVTGTIRSIATKKTTVTDTWNGVTSAGVTAEWLGEAVEAADASPGFDDLQITPKKAAAWIFGSYEVLQDSNFSEQLATLLADAKMRLEEAAFATGNSGATIPRGVVAAVAAVTNSIVTSAAINAFAVADVYRAHDAVQPRGSDTLSWVANRKIYSRIRQFDTAGSGSFWANLGSTVPNQLLGENRYENSTMESAVTTSGSVLLLGNFASYYIVDRVGMSVLYDPVLKSTGNNRPSGQAGWFGFWRVGADVSDPSQFRLLRLHTTATHVPLA
jgi:HK97 family phage major capsid protein